MRSAQTAAYATQARGYAPVLLVLAAATAKEMLGIRVTVAITLRPLPTVFKQILPRAVVMVPAVGRQRTNVLAMTNIRVQIVVKGFAPLVQRGLTSRLPQTLLMHTLSAVMLAHAIAAQDYAHAMLALLEMRVSAPHAPTIAMGMGVAKTFRSWRSSALSMASPHLSLMDLMLALGIHGTRSSCKCAFVTRRIIWTVAVGVMSLISPGMTVASALALLETIRTLLVSMKFKRSHAVPLGGHSS